VSDCVTACCLTSCARTPASQAILLNRLLIGARGPILKERDCTAVIARTNLPYIAADQHGLGETAHYQTAEAGTLVAAFLFCSHSMICSHLTAASNQRLLSQSSCFSFQLFRHGSIRGLFAKLTLQNTGSNNKSSLSSANDCMLAPGAAVAALARSTRLQRKPCTAKAQHMRHAVRQVPACGLVSLTTVYLPCRFIIRY
jgi:hypothetical protein